MKLLFAVKNVAAHAEEMGEAAPPEPVFFQKPASCLQEGPELSLPEDIGPIEYEVELAVQVEKPLSRATPEAARNAMGKVGIVLDLTARELQAQRKKAGLPWYEAKGFDGACVLGPLVELGELEDELEALAPTLHVNGEARQGFSVADYRYAP
ncbi:MAG: fumarylacetoacetate hydrolase family protein, partial [Candidatus Thermoplasmatota archaeon]|nr:fumarylacetoacetate hydrolase family protein [Candidatus Thermoplasmatota archaeon]